MMANLIRYHGPRAVASAQRHTASALLLLGLLVLACPVSTLAAPESARQFDDSAITTNHYPEWFKASFLDLAADLEQAIDAGKKGLFVFFDTEGCAYCAAFVKHSLGDPDIEQTLRRHFDAVGMDMFQDDELVDFRGNTLPVKEFAKREGAVASPTLVFYGRDGKPLFRAVGYYPPERFRNVLDFVVGDHYQSMSFRAFTARQREPRAVQATGELIADPLFAPPPYMLDRRSPAPVPLVVIFETPQCPDCRQFHEHVLSHPPVRRQLADFEVVQFDVDDNRTPIVAPDGERTSPARWAEILKIAATPTLVFFSEQGDEVLRFDSLVLRQRMQRALMYVREQAYRDGSTYQRFTREKSIERLRAEQP